MLTAGPMGVPPAPSPQPGAYGAGYGPMPGVPGGMPPGGIPPQGYGYSM